MAGALALAAGAGPFPVELAARCKAEGRPVFVVRIPSMTDPALDAYPGLTLPLGMFGAQLRAMRAAGCRQLMFSGKVMRPSWRQVRLDWAGFRCLIGMLARGFQRDDALQRVVAAYFEAGGMEIVGPADIWPDLLVSAGILAGHEPTADNWIDIRAGAKAALEIGRADLGQAAVARDGAVIDIEDRGHTDGLLRRVAALPGRGGVLVKFAKPQQDRRLDLPTIGPDTIALAAAAHLSGIAIEADATIVVQRDEVVREANDAGLFIHAFDPCAVL